jgi:hypothetical protein
MVEDLIRRARRRFVFNEALGQLAFAGAITIAGLALILIFGTRYLEWWTLALFGAIGLSAGIARAWRAAPDEYSTAVRIDANAKLSDTLSTAFYFSKHPTEFPEYQSVQRAQAEAAVCGIDLDGAVPFTFPRALYALAAMAVLSSTVMLIRFSSGHGLDLRPPLTEVLFEDQAAKQGSKKLQNANDADRRRLETAESLLAKLGVPLNPEDQKQDAAALDKAIEQALDGAPAAGEKGQKGQSGGKSQDGKAATGAEKSPDGDPLDGKPTDGADQNGDNKTPGGQDGPQGDKGNSKNNSADNSSMLSKLKDAMSNMFSKAKQDGAAGKKDQQAQGQSAKSEKGQGEKGSTGKGQDQAQTDADGQDGEPSNDAQQGQQAQGKAGSKSSQQSAQSGSGVGSQDGAKDLKAAEQLKAMGKISEIIGKRAATVSGETTIEVQSGNQQLRTAYSNTTAAHGEADSDVNRDEIPVALQPYIQQYFEQVRKSTPPPAKPKTAP